MMVGGRLGARLWRLCRRVGIARPVRRGYVAVETRRQRGSYRRTVGGVDVEFPVTNWYELRRARGVLAEEAVIESLLADLDGDEVVWDVGATIGTYACFVARRLDDGHVVAFEPSQPNRERLAATLRSNAPAGRWRTSPAALWDEDGPGTLRAASDDEADVPGMGHHHLATGEGRPVACRRGETLVEDGLDPPDVLKVDVQGAERQVLRGLGEYLDGVDVCYVEVHPRKSERYGASAEGIEEFLRRAGFSLERIGPGNDGRDDVGEDVYHVRASRAHDDRS